MDDQEPVELNEAAAAYRVEPRSGFESRGGMWPVPGSDGMFSAQPHLVFSAADFKTKCLALMDLVDKHGGDITITKRGKPVAKLVPATTDPRKSLKGSVLYTADDIDRPRPELWRRRVE